MARDPAELRDLQRRLRRESMGADVAAFLRRRVDLSGPVHEIPYDDALAALRAGLFEVDRDASRLWWHERVGPA